MKLVLFGATGNVGSRVAQEARRRGHEVVGVVRDPAAAQSPVSGLALVRGDATDAASVASVARGGDAVVSAISPRPNARGLPAPSLPGAARALLAGLRQAGVKRFLFVGGAGSLEVSPGQALMDQPGFPAAYRAEALASREALQILRAEAGDLEWTYLSPAAEIAPRRADREVPDHRRCVPDRCRGQEQHHVRGLRGGAAGRARAPEAPAAALRGGVLSAGRAGAVSSTAPRLRAVGVISSRLVDRDRAPMQGMEGAPDAWLEVRPWAARALQGIAAGDELIVITWLHQARRDTLRVHPRSDPRKPLTGVFATRSPDRPNPLGLHPVTVRAVEGRRLRIGPLEAIDGTPVVDIKPVIREDGRGLTRPGARSPRMRSRTRTRPTRSRTRR